MNKVFMSNHKLLAISRVIIIKIFSKERIIKILQKNQILNNRVTNRRQILQIHDRKTEFQVITLKRIRFREISESVSNRSWLAERRQRIIQWRKLKKGNGRYFGKIHLSVLVLFLRNVNENIFDWKEIQFYWEERFNRNSTFFNDRPLAVFIFSWLFVDSFLSLFHIKNAPLSLERVQRVDPRNRLKLFEGLTLYMKPCKWNFIRRYRECFRMLFDNREWNNIV